MTKPIFFISAILFFSCQTKLDKVLIESDESQILNIALNEVVGSDTTYRYHLKERTPPVPFKAFSNEVDSAEYFKQQNWVDSVQKILDTATLFVAVYKQNEDFVEFFKNKILDTIRLKKTDTLFNNVLIILCDQNSSKDTLNLHLLNPKYNFKIYNGDTAPFDQIRRIASLRFSKIAFNLTKDEACVYTSFSCGEFCGKGDIHFFIKQNDKWKYIRKWELWAS